jgi:hypothetical protein
MLRAPLHGDGIVAYRWTLAGPNGRSGRLDATVTRAPENRWTAPLLPTSGEVSVQVVARTADGAEHTAPAIPLAAAGIARHRLEVFARFAAAEPTAARPAEDAQGRWLASDAATQRLARTSAGWLTWEAFGGRSADAAPSALRVNAERTLALSATGMAIEVLDRSGEVEHAITLTDASRATDLAIAHDGRWLLAEAGGVRVVDEGGATVVVVPCPAGRPTRLAVSDGGAIYALAPERARVQVFDRTLAPEGSWPIALGERQQAVDIAADGDGAMVLLSDGEVRRLGREGERDRISAAKRLSPASSAPAWLAVGSDGEALVGWTDERAIARLAVGGWQAGVRGLGTRLAGACAADGLGRLWTVADGELDELDPQGWCVARRSAFAANLSAVVQLAVSADGRFAAIAYVHSIVRIDLAGGGEPLLLGTQGYGDQRVTRPLALAFDREDDLWALDGDHRDLAVFDSRELPGLRRIALAGIVDPQRLALWETKAGTIFAYLAGRDGEIGKFEGGPDQTRLELRERRSRSDLKIARLDAIGCDRLGALFALDQAATVRAFDWSGNDPDPIAACELAEAGTTAMSVSPDGQVWICSPGGLTGLRWTR